MFDNKERLLINSADSLAAKLGCSKGSNVRIVAVLGKTGTGKSTLLNQTFFNDRDQPVFPRRSAADGTLGVLASFNEDFQLLVLDTDGLECTLPHNDNSKKRLLMKIMSAADIIVYSEVAAIFDELMYSTLKDIAFLCDNHVGQTVGKVINLKIRLIA